MLYQCILTNDERQAPLTAFLAVVERKSSITSGLREVQICSFYFDCYA